MRKKKQDGTTGEDMVLSDRRRLWGYDCPCLDVDVMIAHHGDVHREWHAIEYAFSKAVAEFEFKQHVYLTRDRLEHENTQVFLTRPLALPMAVVVYEAKPTGQWPFWIPAREDGTLYANDIFQNLWPKTELSTIKGMIEGVRMDEETWVRFEYSLRNLVVPKHVIESIRTGKLIRSGRKPFTPEEA